MLGWDSKRLRRDIRSGIAIALADHAKPRLVPRRDNNRAGETLSGDV
jgi:hypothetical protein